jgi:hypothetical protein
MSLVRLLTTGRSLVGLKESSNRYRVTDQRLLPKFNSKRNPFGLNSPGVKCDRPETAPAPAAAKPICAPASPRTAPQPIAGPSVKSLPKLPQGATRTWLSRWLAGLKNLAFSKAGKAQKLGLRPSSKPLVQTELSLDSVKVVRNDLRDSDLEVVAVKAPVAKGLAVEKAPVGARTKAGSMWTGMAGRLFGVNKD